MFFYILFCLFFVGLIWFFAAPHRSSSDPVYVFKRRNGETFDLYRTTAHFCKNCQLYHIERHGKYEIVDPRDWHGFQPSEEVYYGSFRHDDYYENTRATTPLWSMDSFTSFNRKEDLKDYIVESFLKK